MTRYYIYYAIGNTIVNTNSTSYGQILPQQKQIMAQTIIVFRYITLLMCQSCSKPLTNLILLTTLWERQYCLIL